MLRCPTCVTIVRDLTVRRCPVCNENFKRHPPKIIGTDRRMSASTSSWDITRPCRGQQATTARNPATAPGEAVDSLAFPDGRRRPETAERGSAGSCAWLPGRLRCRWGAPGRLRSRNRPGEGLACWSHSLRAGIPGPRALAAPAGTPSLREEPRRELGAARFPLVGGDRVAHVVLVDALDLQERAARRPRRAGRASRPRAGWAGCGARSRLRAGAAAVCRTRSGAAATTPSGT